MSKKPLGKYEVVYIERNKYIIEVQAETMDEAIRKAEESMDHGFYREFIEGDPEFEDVRLVDA